MENYVIVLEARILVPLGQGKLGSKLESVWDDILGWWSMDYDAVYIGFFTYDPGTFLQVCYLSVKKNRKG